MCELLVKAVDANHPDPVINLAGCYKRGDVVAIRENGFQWGSGELDTNMFSIISMPDKSVGEMKHMLYSNDKPIPKTAALKIPALRKLVSQGMRDTINRKRFSIDITTQQITDKART